MKLRNKLVGSLLTVVFLAAPLAGFTAEPQKKTKPYTLDTCLVSGEKLDAMGKPYVFTHKDQEIKLCCKSCLKSFDKDPDKYLKKLADAEKKKAK